MKTKFIIFSLFAALMTSCVDYNTDSGFPKEEENPNFEQNEVRLWVTNQNKVYKLTELPIDYNDEISKLVIRINPSITYQTIDGFGGGMTGSSAYLFTQMSTEARSKALHSLFDPKEGIGLEHIRLSIGASDFSMGLYTYCDKAGIENFAVPELDKRDLIPVLKEILAINPNIKFIASPWSAPAWMKDSGLLNKGKLKGEEVYDDFATYFVKYIQAMKAEGITIQAITLQNEAMFESNVHPSMIMSAEEQATIIGQYLGPKLRKEELDTEIYVLDHNFDIYDYALTVLKNKEAYKYVAGTAFHGYAGTPSVLSNLTKAFPNKKIYMTELSGGEWNEKDEMKTLFYYLNDMAFPMIANGGNNFMMFNLALNSQHGPLTPGGEFCKDCRGVLTIDGDEVLPELEYYLLGHFGKIIRTGAKRIEANLQGMFPEDIKVMAFLNPNGTRALLAVNNGGTTENITIKDESTGKKLVYKLAPSSVISLLLK